MVRTELPAWCERRSSTQPDGRYVVACYYTRDGHPVTRARADASHNDLLSVNVAAMDDPCTCPAARLAGDVELSDAVRRKIVAGDGARLGGRCLADIHTDL